MQSRHVFLRNCKDAMSILATFLVRSGTSKVVIHSARFFVDTIINTLVKHPKKFDIWH